jgi:hypothetical protein
VCAATYRVGYIRERGDLLCSRWRRNLVLKKLRKGFRSCGTSYEDDDDGDGWIFAKVYVITGLLLFVMGSGRAIFLFWGTVTNLLCV